MNSFGGVFIKKKIKGFLRNLNENKDEIIDTFAIKNKNTLTYVINDTIHKLTIKDNIIELSRSNKEFSNKIIFENNKEYKTEYFIKNLNSSIFFKIKTINLKITDTIIEIKYKIIDSEEEYIYLIEMSD